MENGSNISLGGTFFLLALFAQKYIFEHELILRPSQSLQKRVLDLENTTLRASIGSLFSTPLFYSIVQKGHKINAKRPMETAKFRW